MWKQITAGVLCACALGIGGVTAHQAFSSNGAIKTDQQVDQANRAMAKRYNAKYRELTADQLNKDLAKSSVDLDAAKKDATDRINNSFNTAYNNLARTNMTRHARILRLSWDHLLLTAWKTS